MARKALWGLSVVALVLIASGCPVAPEPTFYPRILIETYKPRVGAPVPLTRLYLYDSGGTLLDFNDRSALGADDTTRLDYTGGLNSGTYYIKVTGDGSAPHYYAVRALSLSLGETPPAYDYPGGENLTEDDTDGDDTDTGNVPDNPVDISLGNTNWLNRAINPPSDIDWLRLVLP